MCIVEVSIKEVQNLIANMSKSRASTMINQCRDALGKAKHQILSIKEFKAYYDIKTEEDK